METEKWSRETSIGTFVIERRGAFYDLLFYEQFGDIDRLHYSDTLAEIMVFLFSAKHFKTLNQFYRMTALELGIPTELSEWTNNS